MYRNFQKLAYIYFVLALFTLSCSQQMQSSEESTSIDRYALVNRHNVKFASADTFGGNCFSQ